jgi:arsenite/tail-anchored protein-transporting ATPase
VPQAGMQRFWEQHADALGGVVPQLALPPASSVVPVPGAAELALLAELARAEADLVVLDAGPLDAAVALLGLPGALHWWLGQLLPARLRALASLAGPGGAAGAALGAVPALERLLAGTPLAHPTSVSVCLTALPRRGAATALRSASTALALHGLAPAAAVVRVLPGGEGPWWAERTAEQADALAELADVAPVIPVEEAAGAPSGGRALTALLDGIVLPGVDAPASGGIARPAPRRTATGWDLVVPLPFAELTGVELTRFGDDLVVTAAGTRRSLRLDPLLRRCSVTGGRLVEPGTATARLEIGFEPDPRLWPADLLAAHAGST